MHRDAIASAAVALVCVGAVGIVAGELDTSVSTDPDDVIDLDWRNLPLSEDQAREVKEEMESNADGSAIEEEPRSGPGEGESLGQSEEPQAGGGGGSPEPPDLWDRLLALLEAILPVLALIVGVAVLGWVVRRYWSRLQGLLAGPPEGSDDSDAPESRFPLLDASNEIDRAWLAMVRRLDVERPRARTPHELATAAKAAGLNESAVNTLTRLFVERHYGPIPVVDSDERAAVEARRVLDRGGTG